MRSKIQNVYLFKLEKIWQNRKNALEYLDMRTLETVSENFQKKKTGIQGFE